MTGFAVSLSKENMNVRTVFVMHAGRIMLFRKFERVGKLLSVGELDDCYNTENVGKGKGKVLRDVRRSPFLSSFSFTSQCFPLTYVYVCKYRCIHQLLEDSHIF
jgi:hypothetical protein